MQGLNNLNGQSLFQSIQFRPAVQTHYNKVESSMVSGGLLGPGAGIRVGQLPRSEYPCSPFSALCSVTRIRCEAVKYRQSRIDFFIASLFFMGR
jgi:hypothetical protein